MIKYKYKAGPRGSIQEIAGPCGTMSEFEVKGGTMRDHDEIEVQVETMEDHASHFMYKEQNMVNPQI